MVLNLQFLKSNFGAWQLEHAQKPSRTVSLPSAAFSAIVFSPARKWYFLDLG